MVKDMGTEPLLRLLGTSIIFLPYFLLFNYSTNRKSLASLQTTRETNQNTRKGQNSKLSDTRRSGGIVNRMGFIMVLN